MQFLSYFVSCDGDVPPHPRQTHSSLRTSESEETPAQCRVTLRPACARTVSGEGQPDAPGGVGSSWTARGGKEKERK